jgi:hypothetical protein
MPDFTEKDAERCYAEMLTQDKRTPFYMLGSSQQRKRVGQWLLKQYDKSHHRWLTSYQLPVFLVLVLKRTKQDVDDMCEWKVRVQSVLDQFSTKESLNKLQGKAGIDTLLIESLKTVSSEAKLLTYSGFLKCEIRADIKQRLNTLRIQARVNRLRTQAANHLSLEDWKPSPVKHTNIEDVFRAIGYVSSAKSLENALLSNTVSVLNDQAIATDRHVLGQVFTKDIPDGVYTIDKQGAVSRKEMSVFYERMFEIVKNKPLRALEEGWLIDAAVLIDWLKTEKLKKSGEPVILKAEDGLMFASGGEDDRVVGSYVGSSLKALQGIPPIYLDAAYLEAALKHCAGEYALFTIESDAGIHNRNAVYPLQMLGQQGHFALIMPTHT